MKNLQKRKREKDLKTLKDLKKYKEWETTSNLIASKKIDKMKEIGKRTTNRDQLFFKFACYEEERKPNMDELGT